MPIIKDNIFTCYNKHEKDEKKLNNKKRDSHMGAWLQVDEENKKVRYQADPSWIKNTNDEEQKITFAKLTAIVNVYRRAGYAIIEMAKNLKK